MSLSPSCLFHRLRLGTGALLLLFAFPLCAQPIFTCQPSNQTNLAGSTVTFTVCATGRLPLSYQWRAYTSANSFTNIPWGVEATLVLTNVQTPPRRFGVVVTDAVGLSVTSSPLVTLTVVALPTIQPTNVTARLFAGVTFTGTNAAIGSMTYQWLHDGRLIPGANTRTFTITNLQNSDGGEYAFLVNYSFGSGTSLVSRLTVGPFLIQPTNATATLSAEMTFSNTVTLAEPVSYQWLFNNSPIAGAISPVLTVTNIQKTNAGRYALVATYALGVATSQVAQLRIAPFDSLQFYGDAWTQTAGTIFPNGDLCPLDPVEYYQHRACNGPVWSEFISTRLGLPYVEGNNHAFCAASMDDILAQISLMETPPAPERSMFFMATWEHTEDPAITWYGTIIRGFDTYIPWTNDLAWNVWLHDSVVKRSNMVERLYAKGARSIAVGNERDIGLLPFVRDEFGSNPERFRKLTARIEQHNSDLADTLKMISDGKPDLRLFLMDAFNDTNIIYSNLTQYGFSKAYPGAYLDPALTDKSFTGPGKDYFSWDGAHPTTKFQEYQAGRIYDVIMDSVLETMGLRQSAGTITIAMKHLLIGRDYALQMSSDLTSWTNVQTFIAAAGTNQITQATTGETSVFYRLQWQP